MCTVGYGDILPTTTTEMLLVTVLIFCTCVAFAHTINTLGVIFMNLAAEDTAVCQKIEGISAYMKRKGVSFDL